MNTNLNKAGYIYFIHDLNKNLINIGRTNCIKRRLSEHSKNFKFNILQVIFSEDCIKTERLLKNFFKNKEIESEKYDLNENEILKIKSLDLPKDILASLHSNLDYEMHKSNNLYFMQQLSDKAVKVIERNGSVSEFLNNGVVANETEAYVLKKMIFEPDIIGLEFTKEYIDRLEQILFLAGFWEQSGFEKSGLSFEELLDNKIEYLSLLPNKPKDEHLKDKLLSIRKALEKGMDDQEIIYILNLEIEQYKELKRIIS